MIEKIADDLIGQMTEARLIDKEMEARYVYVFICWIEKFITVGSIIVISLIEYYGAAEPPVRCGESHLSGLTEPLRSL